MERMIGGGTRHYTVLLVASNDVRFVGLRSMLLDEPLVRVVGQVDTVEFASAIGRLRPDAVLVAGDQGGDHLLHVARRLRDVWANAKLLIFVEVVDYALEMALAQLQAASFVLWDDVNPVSLYWLLGGTLAGGWRVVSPLAVDEIAAPPGQRHGCDGYQPISAQERILLAGLVRGASEEELAEAIGKTPRTVRRLFCDLEKGFGAKNRAQLIARAVVAGFEPEVWDGALG